VHRSGAELQVDFFDAMSTPFQSCATKSRQYVPFQPANRTVSFETPY
jgi:hypothetical protein